MTGTEIRDYARRLSRMTDLAAPDTHVNFLINQGIKAFSVDVFGVPLRTYPTISEKFQLRTTMGINVTITGSTNNDIVATDIAITSADADDQTGAQTATMLQAQIRAAIGAGADLTVAYADYAFTISAVTAASIIAITAPTTDAYSDATGMLLGGTGSATKDYVGIFPEMCTWYVSLPTGCQNVERIYWDDVELTRAPRNLVFSPPAYGTPVYYNIWADKLYFYPSPDDQGECYMEYKGIPTDMTTFTAEITSIPEANQEAVVNWVAAQLLREQYDENLATVRYRDYLLGRAKYVTSVANRDMLSNGPGQKPVIPFPKVIV